MNDYNNAFFDFNFTINDYVKNNTLIENDFIQQAILIKQQQVIEEYLIERENKIKITFKRELIIEKKGKYITEDFFIPIGYK
jgi:hypothetical protein